MAKKKSKNDKSQKPLDPALVVLMTMVVVSNSVWGFVMYDFKQKEAAREVYLYDREKFLEVEEKLLEFITDRTCISKRDVWKLFADDGVMRDSETHWVLKPYHFYFSDVGCLEGHHDASKAPNSDENSENQDGEDFKEKFKEDEDVNFTSYYSDDALLSDHYLKMKLDAEEAMNSKSDQVKDSSDDKSGYDDDH